VPAVSLADVVRIVLNASADAFFDAQSASCVRPSMGRCIEQQDARPENRGDYNQSCRPIHNVLIAAWRLKCSVTAPFRTVTGRNRMVKYTGLRSARARMPQRMRQGTRTNSTAPHLLRSVKPLSDGVRVSIATVGSLGASFVRVACSPSGGFATSSRGPDAPLPAKAFISRPCDRTPKDRGSWQVRAWPCRPRDRVCIRRCPRLAHRLSLLQPCSRFASPDETEVAGSSLSSIAVKLHHACVSEHQASRLLASMRGRANLANRARPAWTMRVPVRLSPG
jgi:hypothetical protein